MQKSSGSKGARSGGPSDRETSQGLARRQFLKSAAVMGAGILAGADGVCARSAIPQTQNVLIGGHAWVYAARLPGYDYTPVLEQIFSDFRYARIEAFELMDTVLLHEYAVEHIHALSLKYSIPILGSSFEGDMWDRSKHPIIMDKAQTVITRLAQLGGRTLGTSVGRAPDAKTPEQLDAQAEILRKIIALGQAQGVVLNLHNHTYEVENGMYDLEGTLARIPDVKLGPDLNWLVRAGVDPVKFIHRFGKQIVFLHVRDQNADGTWSEAVGEGNMDYASIAKALHAIPFTGDAVIELAHERGFRLRRPLREDWKISRDFVHRTMGYGE